MIRCPSCRETNNHGSTRCRFCSSVIPDDVRGRQTLERVVLWVVAIIFLVGFVRSCGADDRPRAAASVIDRQITSG